MNAVDSAGITPLMLAARRGEAASVAELLKARADVDAADHNGNTVLMHAAASGNRQTVEQVLAVHPNIAARDVQDWSALDFAEVAGFAEVAARLRAAGATALHRSAVDTSSAPSSVQRAPQRDLYAGWPDLAVAATRPAAGLAQALLTRGADPNLTTPDGTPILTAAALGGTPSTVEALLSGGAQPTRPDRHGASTLLAAVRAGRWMSRRLSCPTGWGQVAAPTIRRLPCRPPCASTGSRQSDCFLPRMQRLKCAISTVPAP